MSIKLSRRERASWVITMLYQSIGYIQDSDVRSAGKKPKLMSRTGWPWSYFFCSKFLLEIQSTFFTLQEYYFQIVYHLKGWNLNWTSFEPKTRFKVVCKYKFRDEWIVTQIYACLLFLLFMSLPISASLFRSAPQTRRRHLLAWERRNDQVYVHFMDL